MSKITLLLFTLLASNAMAQVEGDGGDPNMAPGGYAGTKQGADVGCLTGDCSKNGFDAIEMAKENSRAIKDAIDGKDKKFKLRKEDYASTAEEQKAVKMRELQNSINGEEPDTIKAKEQSKLKDAGTIPVGGKMRVRPSRHGIKVKYEDSF